MRADLKTRLRADAGLTTLSGARIHWKRRPRGGALPAVVMHLVSPGRIYHHGGAAALEDPRVQFDVWAESYESAVAVVAALKSALETTGTTGATAFKGGFLEAERDFDPDTVGDAEIVRISLDYRVWHQPAS